MRGISNQHAFALYRQRLAGHFKTYHPEKFGSEADLGLPGSFIVRAWFDRYAARSPALTGRMGPVTTSLLDNIAIAAITARNAARDAANVDVPTWPEALKAFVERMFAGMVAAGKELDARSLLDPHLHGPSLRTLFTEAKLVGLSDDEAWTHVRDWAIRPPRIESAPPISELLRNQLETPLAWRDSEEPDFPWVSTDGAWRIRLNDFPDDCMYSLSIGSESVGDFNDWPAAWERAGMKPKKKQVAPSRKTPKQSVSAPAIEGIAATRWISRYQAGECQKVWAEMVSLGPDVRSTPYLEPAWSVAHETMRRARRNVETIVQRLDQIGYTFWNGRQGPPTPQPARVSIGSRVTTFSSAEQLLANAMARNGSGLAPEFRQQIGHLLEKAKAMRATTEAMRDVKSPPLAAVTSHLEDEIVFSPPAATTTSMIHKLEKAGLTLPLSLKAWAEAVGHVNLSGSHSALCFWQDGAFPGVFADPLMVSLDDLMQRGEEWLDAPDENEKLEIILGWDADTKANLVIEDEQIDQGYSLLLPNPAADAGLNNEPHETHFVDYLRTAFYWGGFPGWENQERRPEKELRFLSDGLLPI
jgi:hypothetical protein